MANDTFYTAIDIGNSKVCTVIATVGPEGELKVLGTGVALSQGIQKGQVENVEEAQQAVKASLDEAQHFLGKGVSWAYVGITGNYVSCINTSGSVNKSADDEPLSSQEMERLIQSSYPEVTPGKEVLHVIPISYVVDGLTAVRNPIGLHAGQVRVDSHVVLGEMSALKNIIKAVERCNVKVNSLVLQPLAAGEAVLTQAERELGAVLVDIGGGTTDIAILRGGNPWYISVIPAGGQQITRDLSAALGVPYHQAEEIKMRWGNAMPEAVPATDEVILPSFQGAPQRTLKRRALCQPVHDRLAEIFKLVLQKIRHAGLRRIPPGGLVITGGTAEIPGIIELAKKITLAPARIAHPAGIFGLPAELRKPSFSTSVGLLLWGIKHQGEQRTYRNGERTLWGSRLFGRRRKGMVALGQR